MAKNKENKLLNDVAESKRWLKEHPNVEKKYIKMAESYEPKEKAKEAERKKKSRCSSKLWIHKTGNKYYLAVEITKKEWKSFRRKNGKV